MNLPGFITNYKDLHNMQSIQTTTEVSIPIGAYLSQAPQMWQNFMAGLADIPSGPEKAQLVCTRLAKWNGQLQNERTFEYVVVFPDQESFLQFWLAYG